ncbi:putative UDP-glucosyltransferase [Tripterygium wilfordii]|uniref:Glycosyltransferase n=1 Tax=Tripterygium wilfordii TaxID=458696 RepID=A0A7J7CZW3_TRIWF|nr:UDP-glycosyltransferase 90A1-like [Tripterygium wilfordii]KAF5739631.1 putative UDP-glucosyltransferase [Tripterygium wilfordii]
MSAINDSQYHVVLFPFMSKGHTIPLLYLARLLLRRNIAVTIFTTPANRPFIANSLRENSSVSIIDIPFPENIPEIPPGIESTDKLPSISLFPQFGLSTKKMQPYFESELERLPRVDFMVSDGFLWWTLDSANKFGFPRLVFFGMSIYSSCVSRAAFEDKLLFGPESDTDPITLTRFPWIRVTKRGFDRLTTDPKTLADFKMLTNGSMLKSYGVVMNTFYELEPVFVDDYNSRHGEPKGWCVGPLCLADDGPEKPNKPNWILDWLDQKLEQGRSVLYIAFGSQAEISTDQIKEIAIGLEKSGVDFLWVIRKSEAELGEGFEERVKGRGIVVRDWVNQWEILEHQSVQGFLSHCGWNSVLEGICAGVPILAWPMMAEQPLNAKMVVEEIKVGFRVETSDGFVKWERLEKMVKELMEGEMGKEVRKNVKVIADTAEKAMEENSGSSWKTLDLLIQEICDCPNKVAEVLN